MGINTQYGNFTATVKHGDSRVLAEGRFTNTELAQEFIDQAYRDFSSRPEADQIKYFIEPTEALTKQEPDS